MVEKYSRFLRRFDWAIVIVSILLFVLTINYVIKIRVKSDFKTMLPDKAASVINLNRLEKNVRGTDNLIVLIGGSNWGSMKRFVDDFSARMLTEFPDEIQRVDNNVSVLRNFYDKNKYLYLDLDDLKELYLRLKRKIDYEKLKESPLYINLGDEEPDFTTKDIEDKYKDKTSTYQSYKENYFTNEKVDLAAIIVWPKVGATNIDFAKTFMAKLDKLAKKMNPKGYDPDLKIAFGGRLRKMVLEYEAVIGDILKTSVLCLSLVGLLVLVYFRRFRMGFLMTVNVAQGTLAALAIAFFSIGYLTSQTAFLAAIIVGNGIDYSLILMSRYLEERRDEGKNIDDSLSISIDQTWRPTVTSMLTTSAAFFALMVTNIKSFAQFGFIGGIGMPLCWLATYFILPAWLSITERVWAIKSITEIKKSHLRLMEPISAYVMSRGKAMMKIGAVVIGISFIAAVWYVPNSLEFNFDRLGFKAPVEEEGWDSWARDQVSNIFGGKSTTPSIVLAKDVVQSGMICDEIEKRDKELGGGYVEKCQSLASFLPKDQDEKLEVLSDMRNLLSGSALKFLNEEQLKEVEKFRSTFDLKPIELEKLPVEISRNFTDKNGNEGVVAYVYPKADLWNGHELIKFANIIRKIELPNGEVVESSGHPVILADLLKAVVEEGPRVTLFSLFTVLLLVWINFRRAKETILVSMALFSGVSLQLAIAALIGIKLNFLNFVALPITFGIGVDYAVNVFQRAKQDGFVDVGKSLSRIGGPVALCSATTAIGYGVILTSRSQALVTFGELAFLGETACLIVALFLLPPVIRRMYSTKV